MSDEILFTIKMPIDNEGYVLLKCPKCGELFKLHPSDYKDDTIFNVYCPCCGLVSDSYVTEDVLELANVMIENYTNELVMKELKKLERQTKKSIVQIKVKNKPKKREEMPIMLMMEALDEKNYPCCKMSAKIKPILKMSGSYCPYCGVMDYGIE